MADITGVQPWSKTSLVNGFFAAMYPEIGVASMQKIITVGAIHEAVPGIIIIFFYNSNNFINHFQYILKYFL